MKNFCAMRSVCICVFLSYSMIIVIATSQADQCRQLKFPSEKAFDGKRFINHGIRIIEIMVVEFCETMCYMEPNCVSINIDKRADGNGKYKCELNNVTHEGHKDELIEDGHFSYHAAETACVKNSCKNNATCQSGFTDEGYRCLCTAGFKGQTCDEDVNECAVGNHDCGTNAVCNNTKGSYNCT
ncbi:adhesive plaque matrix protein 2-like, partial [Stylophora pistillata]